MKKQEISLGNRAATDTIIPAASACTITITGGCRKNVIVSIMVNGKPRLVASVYADVVHLIDIRSDKEKAEPTPTTILDFATNRDKQLRAKSAIR